MKWIWILAGALLFAQSYKGANNLDKLNNLKKVEVYIYGKKETLYLSDEKAIFKNNRLIIKKDLEKGFPVFYKSESMDKEARLVATNELIIKLPKNVSIKEVEKEYGLKYKNTINKKIGLYVFEINNSTNLIDLLNKLNKQKILAKPNFISQFQLF